MNEELRPYGTDSTDPPAEPLTREEQYLSAIAGVTSSSDIPPKPLTRTEKYLNKIVENGGGGGGGGTTDYNDLSNKPKLNSVELTGNLSLPDVGAQAALDTDQMAAVNSGISSADVAQIGTNKNNILLINRQTNNANGTIDIATDMTFLSSGFIQGDGTIGTAAAHAVYYMTLGNIKELIFTLDSVVGSVIGLAMLKSADDTLKHVYLNNKTLYQTFKITDGEPTDKLYVSFFNYQSVPNPYYSTFGIKDYNLISETYKTEITEIAQSVSAAQKYHSCVEKPLSLSGKKLQFFGDSITWGYINPTTRANPTYPDAVGTAFSATVINSGRSAATLSEVSGYPSIYTEIQNNLDTTADVLFIAGGINDWQLGVNAATLSTAMDNIITYLGANYTGKVIFITPINHGGRTPMVTPTQTLDSVRKIITEKALVAGYSVIQGWEFPFPTENNNISYINAMYADKIHPTQTGYNIYAKSLETILA